MVSDRPWRIEIDRLGVAHARVEQFLKELEAFPELRSTPSAARVRWALAQAEELRARFHEPRSDTQADVLKRVAEADKAIRVVEKAIDRVRELMCFVRQLREERKRFVDDLALRLERAKLDRLRTTF
jgi:hypothetical protein